MSTIDIAPDLLIKAIEASNDGMVIVDLNLPDQPIIYANPAFETMTGYSHLQVVGRNCRFLQGPDSDQSALQTLRSAVAHHQHCEVTLKNYKKSGELFYNRLSLSPVNDSQGNPRYYIGVQKDVSQEVMLTEHLHRINTLHSQINESLSQESQVDQLTGLKNQRYLDEAGGLLFSNAKREGWKMSVYRLTLTNALSIETQHTRAMLEVALQSIAGQITRIFARDSDVCTRLTDEQFVIITIAQGEAEAKERIKQLKKALVRVQLYSSEIRTDIPLDTKINYSELSAEDYETLDDMLKIVS